MAFPAKGHCFMEEPRADILNSTPGPPVPMETAEEFVMDVQVEVQFTIQPHPGRAQGRLCAPGPFPDWRVIQDTDTRPQLFFETRIVSVNLSSEADRFAWFVFSLEACGELQKRVVITNVVPSGVKVDIPRLTDFLDFCRNCLVGRPPALILSEGGRPLALLAIRPPSDSPTPCPGKARTWSLQFGLSSGPIIPCRWSGIVRSGAPGSRRPISGPPGSRRPTLRFELSVLASCGRKVRSVCRPPNG